MAIEQRRRACTMLELLRNCRNVLGFSDDLIPPLRFDALLRIALQLVDLAHSAERDLLQFREQFEANSFSVLQAQNALVLSEAELSLEALNVSQAEGDVRLADLQRAQSDSNVSYVEGLLQQGLLPNEQIALNLAMASFGLQTFGVAAEWTGGSGDSWRRRRCCDRGSGRAQCDRRRQPGARRGKPSVRDDGEF